VAEEEKGMELRERGDEWWWKREKREWEGGDSEGAEGEVGRQWREERLM
jgi:hypothetical protein